MADETVEETPVVTQSVEAKSDPELESKIIDQIEVSDLPDLLPV